MFAELERDEFEVATKTITISPDHQVPLGASNAGRRPWGGIGDSIELNALLVRAGSDSPPVLLVSMDVLYIGSRLREEIVDASGLPEANVVTFASHTHRAPMIDDSKPLLGEIDAAYRNSLISRVRACIRSLMGSGSDRVRLFAAHGTAEHSINRRRRKHFTLSIPPTFGKVVNAPNIRGARDETLITATMRDSRGRAVAVIWNYACHPVAGPHQNLVSAHFPGFVRDRIRKEEGDEQLPVLFLQGFSGNTRPNASGRARSFVRRVQRALTGPVFQAMDRAAYDAWAMGLAGAVVATRQSESLIPVASIATQRELFPASSFVLGANRNVSFSRVDLGKFFTVLAISGEVVAEYAPVARRMVNVRYVCCAGCADDTIGYFPTAEIVAEGGYEAGDYCRDFGLEAVKPTIQTAMVEGFRRITTSRESGGGQPA